MGRPAQPFSAATAIAHPNTERNPFCFSVSLRKRCRKQRGVGLPPLRGSRGSTLLSRTPAGFRQRYSSLGTPAPRFAPARPPVHLSVRPCARAAASPHACPSVLKIDGSA